ncbi:MAG: hypothetical protein ACLVJH_19225 [Faecalibacterium prausnitzii]
MDDLKSRQKYIKNGLTVSADNYEDLAKAMGLRAMPSRTLWIRWILGTQSSGKAGEDKEFGRNNGGGR